jgi:hypothetical protein
VFRIQKRLVIPLLMVIFITGGNTQGGQDWQDGKSKVCVVMTSESNADFSHLVDRVERDHGFQVVFAFPPHAAVGYVPTIVKDRIPGDDSFQMMDDHSFSERSLSSRLEPNDLSKLVAAWNAFSDPESVRGREDKSDSGKAQFPLINDMIVEDSDDRTETWNKLTSEYLIGKVALGIFLMESSGDLENWSNGPPDRPQSVWQKIVIGLNWMHEQAQGRGANIEFWFDDGGYYEAVPTSYEPITMEHGDDDLWMKHAMSYVGYSSGDSDERMYSYLNNLRNSLATDWATIIYVVDDWNDEDNMFADEEPMFAYAKGWDQRDLGFYVLRHGGPCLVMTYDNDNWEHWQMPDVLCHELSHIFGCPDEYPEGYTCREDSPPWNPNCHSDYGYLFTQNYNCEACKENPDPCIMRGLPLAFGMCEWTYRHLGWFDSDGDDIPDPIDPNSGMIAWIDDVAPGDEILIFDLSSAFIKRLNITEANSAVFDGNQFAIWDLTNWNGQDVAPQTFLAVRNGGDPYQLPGYSVGPFPIEFAIPVVDGDTLVCSLTDSSALAYVRLEVWAPGEEQVLYPVRDELLTPQETIRVDLSALPYSDSYTAKCFGWLPDGSLSETYEFVFASEGPLSPVTDLHSLHDYYETRIKIYWDDENSIEDGFAIERKDASVGVWFPLDTVPPGDGQVSYHDYSIVGSETHTYRVRPFTVSGQDGPWSEELQVKAWPMPPENVQCEVLPGIQCCPTMLSNKIRVTWSPPTNQLLPIDYYKVFRWEGGWMGPKFGPIYDTVVEICPNQPREGYEFYAYSFDFCGDSSIVQNYCGATAGPANACPDQTEKAQVAIEQTPSEFRLYQNHPNPFNASTIISYDLPEDDRVKIEIIDMLGRSVRVLFDGFQQAGNHTLMWSGINSDGDPVASGIYFYKITTETHSSTKRMLLLK